MSAENASYWMTVDAVQKLFRQFRFEPGTRFACDLVQYPTTQHGVPNFALRAYKNTYDSLSQKNKLLITEQIGNLIQTIRSSGANCILEVHDAPGKSSGQGRN